MGAMVGVMGRLQARATGVYGAPGKLASRAGSLTPGQGSPQAQGIRTAAP